MSQPGCKCSGCIPNLPIQSVHQFLSLLQCTMRMVDVALPNGATVAVAANTPTPGCLCSACDPTRMYNLHDQLELAEGGFKPFLRDTKGVQSILISHISAPTMNIFPGFMPTPVAPEPKPEEPKYSDATVVKLTELLLESQRKGRMSGSMHDLATKLLEGLYGPNS